MLVFNASHTLVSIRHHRLIVTNMRAAAVAVTSLPRVRVQASQSLYAVLCDAVALVFVRLLVHGQVTIIFVVSVGLSVCLFVCAEFFSAVFDPISIKLGHTLYVWV